MKQPTATASAKLTMFAICVVNMMTLSNGQNFRVTGHLRGDNDNDNDNVKFTAYLASGKCLIVK